jgi:hypothetical protein
MFDCRQKGPLRSSVEGRSCSATPRLSNDYTKMILRMEFRNALIVKENNTLIRTASKKFTPESVAYSATGIYDGSERKKNDRQKGGPESDGSKESSPGTPSGQKAVMERRERVVRKGFPVGLPKEAELTEAERQGFKTIHGRPLRLCVRLVYPNKLGDSCRFYVATIYYS